MQPPVVVVVGPTAAGKSDLALDLAERLDGEVVNTDAMQLYRGMDVGTAKLPLAERRGVPHHLLDVLEVAEAASVAEFQRSARAAVSAVRGRGRVPVLVGGSALYTRAVVDRFEFPGTDPDLRASLETEAERVGAAVMLERLREVDATAAGTIEPGNTRRIVRALEVVQLTGRPFGASLPQQEYALDGVVQLGVRIDRAVVDARVETRVGRMWADGLLDEVRGLLPRGLREGRTAGRAIGYAQAIAQLDGEVDEAEAQRRTTVATRRFVRRQEAWYRRDARICWLPHGAPDLAERGVSVVARSLEP